MSTLVTALACMAVSVLPLWDFEDPADLDDWSPNAHIRNVSVSDGILYCETAGHDPFFTNSGLDIAAMPWQYLLLRIRADRSGVGDLFWTADLEGVHGGFTGEKRTEWPLAGGDTWREVAIFPFWHAEGVIRQLRLDLYDATAFAIDSIRIASWGEGQDPLKDVWSWTFDGDLAAWEVYPGSLHYFAPPLQLPVADREWVTVRMSADEAFTAAVVWAAPGAYHGQREHFPVHGGGTLHTYNLRVPWGAELVALGLDLSGGASANPWVESIEIASEPSGPADVHVEYLGFGNGVNRPGRPCSVMARFRNTGGTASEPFDAQLTVGSGLELAGGATRTVPALGFDEYADMVWTVEAQDQGSHAVNLTAAGADAPQGERSADLRFLESRPVTPADYPPPPEPVESAVDVCMYYFPGWDWPGAWEPIRNVAPVRKPVLGYYYEGDPESVDWQIKWARENGIDCFLVDWYWSAGNRFLEHWMDAYKVARYRDQLQVAIMWANHNPPGSHSRQDWRNVVQYWIEEYFHLPGYYRIDGNPAVFIWAPELLRADLGSSGEVRAAMDEAQAMARDAGYDGITFGAVNNTETSERVGVLFDEGYTYATSYHEWGDAVGMAPEPNRALFEDVVATAPAAWAERNAFHPEVTYLPVVDTGWDSRPWHGEGALAVLGRTPELFEELLNEAAVFCAGNDKTILVLGPANEWGEGSYVEPATEYDFDMYEAIRRVFGLGDPASWPRNVAPVDFGLGPYEDFPPPRPPVWDFEADGDTWTAGGAGIDPGSITYADGALRFDYVAADGFDPALVSPRTLEFSAETHRYLVLEAGFGYGDGGPGPGTFALWEFFWDSGAGFNAEERIAFRVMPNQGVHKVVVDLAAHPLWTGTIYRIRIDPGVDGVNLPGHSCVIEHIAVTGNPGGYVWDFSRGGLQGWCGVMHGRVAETDEGLLFTYEDPGAAGFDPVLANQYSGAGWLDPATRLYFDGTANPYVRATIDMVHSAMDPLEFAFHFWTTGGDIGRAPFQVTPNVGPVTYLVDMQSPQAVSGAPAWGGVGGVRYLRLDLGEGVGYEGFEDSYALVQDIAIADGEESGEPRRLPAASPMAVAAAVMFTVLGRCLR